MRKNEIGRKIYVDVGEDITSATRVELRLDTPVPEEKEVVLTTRDGLAIGVGDLFLDGEPVLDSEGNQVFLNGQYLSYVTRACDIIHDGHYRIRSYVEFNNGLEAYYGPWVEFIVGE